MRRRTAIPTLGLASIVLATPLLAAPVPFRIDPAHSQVSFTIRHFFSRVPGRFNDFAGTIQLDASINGGERRDKDLRSSNFFAVDSFPTLSFKSTKVAPGEGGKLTIEGNLTMRGVTRPVTLQGTFLGAGPVNVEGGYNAGYRAGFEATSTIDRKDFNIVWNKTLDQGGTMLGDDVAITIGIEAVRVEADKAGGMPAAEKKP